MRKRTDGTKIVGVDPAAGPDFGAKTTGHVDSAGKFKVDKIEFDTAQPGGKPKPASMSDDFERITETVFINNNAFDEYRKLEADLRVGEKRNDHGSVNQALDNAESNARMAHKLWMTAKVELEKWELDNAVIFASMRDEVTSTLQAEKEQGKRAKQITDADVENAMALHYGDEWKHHQLRRRKFKLMADSMGNLNELWISRCRSLQAMLAKQR
jgi:hypothetical protein